MNNILKNQTVLIEPLALEHAPACLAAVRESIADLTPHFSWCQDNYDEAVNRARIEKCIRLRECDQEYHFVVLTAKHRRLVGEVAVDEVNSSEGYGNLLYWIRTSSQGQGLAAAAASAMAEFAFGTLRFKRLKIMAAVDNTPSIRVAEAIGAEFAELVPEYRQRNGQIKDFYRYTLRPGAVQKFKEKVKGQ